MTALTGWAPGGLGTGWLSAFAAADLNGLAQLSSVMSSLTFFDNTAGAQQFMDVSFDGAIASSTIASGAGMAFFLAILQGNGTTFYDGRMTAGTQYANTTYTPLMNPIGGFPISPGTAITVVHGSVLNVTIPPAKIGLVIQNQSGFALAGSGACQCNVQFYRQNTNM